MAGLKELRTRIETIKSTQKITAAMKMVAASRLRRVQILVDKNQGYSENLRLSALRVMTEIEDEEREKHIRYMRPMLLRQITNPQKYLLYVLSSERGLCGSYNANVAKKAIQRINDLLKHGKKVEVVCIGKKAYDILRRNLNVEALNLRLADDKLKNLSYNELSKALSHSILQKFANKQFDVCEMVYARFVSAITRNFVCEQVCPLELNSEHLNKEELLQISRVKSAFYEYLPDKLSVLENIVPILFEDNIFKVVVNSAASEHGARMTSMDNATRNAKDMISELTLKYNSLRQSAITTELIEIIAGAEAI